MSVTTTVLRVRRRPLINRTGDPSLPEMVWYTQAGVSGDGSGGHAEINIELNPAGATRSGRAWSIMVSLYSLAIGNDGLEVVFNSFDMDNLGPGLNNPIQKTFTQVMRSPGTGIQAPESSAEPQNLHPNLFLGAQMASTLPARIRTQTVNSNGQTYGWFCAGYEWGPQSLNAGYSLPLGGFIG